MTPPAELDADLVQRKLEVMRRGLAGVRRHQPVTAERLERDPDYAAAVERYLAQLVDVAVSVNAHLAASGGVDVPGDYASSFDAAARVGAISEELAGQLRPSVGLRNVLVHAYDETDHRLVARAANEGVSQFDAYVASVAGFVIDRT